MINTIVCFGLLLLAVYVMWSTIADVASRIIRDARRWRCLERLCDVAPVKFGDGAIIEWNGETYHAANFDISLAIAINDLERGTI